MAESPYSRIFWIVTAAAVTATGSGLTMLGLLYAGQQVQKTEMVGLKESLAEVKTQMTAATMNRYTSQDATTDRAALISLITAQTTRNTEQDKELIRLAEFKARVEERMKMGNQP